ncbi:S8 family serine peptidase|uniref:S8 family serine peptidase n=1 Tax=Pseudomonas sp. SbOxS1 TaxID=2723884 RepID=UPI0015D3AED4|nr:S8 family serine peptidase [Pseudomonas sp. SbOxS1]NYU04884.1 S8 family serine peptidase [Pseudomonas sp. SbOxS1]
MTPIMINGITINTSAPKVMLAALSLDNATATDSDYVLVQTSHPLKAAERTELAKAGAHILEAVPGALICHFPGTDLAKLRALSFVSWADVYPNVVKIGPRLLQIPPKQGGVEAAAAVIAKTPALDSDRITVDAVLHCNADVKNAAKRIAEAAHLHESELSIQGNKIRLTLKRRRLADVAAVDDVRHIEGVVARKLFNNIARTILGIEDPNTNTAIPYTGKGELIAIADTGFDLGSTTDVHAAFTGRVKKLYALGRAGKKDDPDGHGTHVAGSVLGDGISTSDGPVKGAAPGAKLIFQSVLDDSGGLGGLPDELEQLFTTPYTSDKARIHTNSWGSTGNFGQYDGQARALDKFVFEHRDMLICFAAGNAGTDRDANGQIDLGSVTPPGTAKNCLTVGASENSRPEQFLTYGQGWPAEFSADPIKSDRVANSAEGMVAFSSRGPTTDGRIKPDVVAPGSYILSTRSRATRSEGWGLSDDPLYMFEGGTSMATPLVAGSAAVVREFLRVEHNLKSPSAALIKALIINGAYSLAGQYPASEAGASPNNSQGFGRVDVHAIVAADGTNKSIQLLDEDMALDTGENQVFNVPVPIDASQLKVTLVWTDPPGEGLQNDLDLSVEIGGDERHGNMSPGSLDFDRTNNVEQVFWRDVPGGTANITVSAFSIALEEQSFALVVRFC